MPIINKKHKALKPAHILVFGFAVAILIGAFLLSLPIATRAGQSTEFVDALFTSTSAMCVTGMSIFDTYTHWTVFGQATILVLVQAGGLGLLSLVTLFNFAAGRKIGLVYSKDLASEHSLDGLNAIRKTFVRILLFSLSFEAVGAVLFMFTFVPKYGKYGIFVAVFTAVSSFYNAGFDLMGIEPGATAFENYLGNASVLVPIAVLITLGGLGYVVWSNLAEYYKTKKLNMHTRVVLIMSGLLFVIGAAGYFAILCTTEEFNIFSVTEKITLSLFNSVSARTAGIVVLPVHCCNELSSILTMLLMFIGGAPGSTAGGIKVTTFAIIIATVISVIKNREDTILLGHIVSKERVYKTLTVLSLTLVFLLAAFTIIYVESKFYAIDVLFETISAFTTTGFSNGIVSKVNNVSRIVLAVTMYVGRIGPVSLIMMLSMNSKKKYHTVYPESEIMVG